MIAGIGCDILEVTRVEKLIRKYGQHFLDRLFSPKEQSYCESNVHASEHYAGRFAAKESISKALGTGFGGHLSWLDIEILKDSHGKPYVVFSEKAKLHFKDPQMMVTISHSREYAMAFAVWEM